MVDRPCHRRSLFAVWRWPWWVWALIVPLLLIAYPLSIGPVYWMLSREGVPPVAWTVIGAVYAPLGFVSEYIPPLKRAIELYLYWWIPAP
jgi:hypothetical protein